MQNLYWKNSAGKTVNLVNTPFETEEKLESFVYQHQDLLEDIFIFKRQIRSGSHQGIPDMLGVDQDGKICLIEIKNVTVSEDILPQVLQYAIWAETNPDSIKALWLVLRQSSFED
jgi:RecB family endonuclease NucS